MVLSSDIPDRAAVAGIPGTDSDRGGWELAGSGRSFKSKFSRWICVLTLTPREAFL